MAGPRAGTLVTLVNSSPCAGRLTVPACRSGGEHPTAVKLDLPLARTGLSVPPRERRQRTPKTHCRAAQKRRLPVSHNLFPQPLTRRICLRCVTAEVRNRWALGRRLAGNGDTPAPGVVEGTADAQDDLLALVYNELRHRASAHLRGERKDHTLQPTALVHETYLRLLAQRRVRLANSCALLRARLAHDAAGARGSRSRSSRGETPGRIAAGDARCRPRERRPARVRFPVAGPGADRAQRPRHAPERIVELCYFGGLSEEEAAEAVSVSQSTVSRELRSAKAWLYRRMTAVAPQEST